MTAVLSTARLAAARSTRTSCPTENAIVGLVQGKGTATERRAIEEHLDECFDCHVLIAAVARAAARESAVFRSAPPSGPPQSAPGGAVVRGTRAGRYRLEEMIGAGAMGVVYTAYDDELARRVAVKVVRPEWGDSEQHRTRLLREACALARVVHPNVVTVFDVGTMSGNVFIAMEHVDGSSLKEWLRARRRSWREILQVSLGAARGLAAAHTAGVVHRDFKPQNVLVDSHGRAVVADFGLACSVGVSAGGVRAAAPPVDAPAPMQGASLTATGAILGTPAYMAPEQRSGAVADTRSDQYSFCVVLYEALHGERPFEGARRSRSRPASRRAASPAWLARALERGLEPDPARRYPSMDALVAALEPKRRAWPWLVPLFALAALVASGTALWRRHVHREARDAREARETCATAARAASDLWTDRAGAHAREGFLRTSLPYAEGTWKGVDRHLRGYVASWSTMRLQVCTDGQRTGRSELVQRQEACLSDRLDELRASTDLFANADAAAVNGALAAVSALTPPAQCSHVGALSPLLSDPSKALKLGEFNAEFARVQALIAIGRYGEAREPAEQAVRAADSLQYGPAQAKAQLNLGAVLRYAGDSDAADAALTRALGLADAAGDDRLRVEAWLGLLVNMATSPKQGFARLPLYEAEAKGAIQRLGGDELLEARLRAKLAIVLMTQGKLAPARSEVEWAIATAKRRLPPEDVLLVRMLSIVGGIAIREGRYADALAAFREALDGATAGSGSDTPAAAEALAYIGTSLGRLDRVAEGLTYSNRGLALVERDLPPDHPAIAMHLDLRASIFAALDRHDEAREDARRSMAILEKRFGRDTPFLVGPLTTIGNTSLALGDVKLAVTNLEHAVALCGTECARLTRADVTFALAKALRRAGRQPKRALALADEAAAIYRDVGDPTAQSIQAWRRAR